MVRLRLTPVLLIMLGAVGVVAGVYLLVGVGWAIIASGLTLAAVGLLIDMDEPGR